MPQLIPISRLLRPCSYLRRNTSWIFRIDSLLPGMEPSTPESLSEEVPYQLVLCVATSPAHWPDCSGIAGRIQMESVAGMEWNRWPESRGIGGRDRLEFAHVFNSLLRRCKTDFCILSDLSLLFSVVPESLSKLFCFVLQCIHSSQSCILSGSEYEVPS